MEHVVHSLADLEMRDYMQHAGAVFQADVAYQSTHKLHTAEQSIVIAAHLGTLDVYPLEDNAVISSAVGSVVDLILHTQAAASFPPSYFAVLRMIIFVVLVADMRLYAAYIQIEIVIAFGAMELFVDVHMLLNQVQDKYQLGLVLVHQPNHLSHPFPFQYVDLYPWRINFPPMPGTMDTAVAVVMGVAACASDSPLVDSSL